MCVLTAVAKMAAILATLPPEDRALARQRLAEVSETPEERRRRQARDRKRKQRDGDVTEQGPSVTCPTASQPGPAPVTAPRASDSLSDLDSSLPKDSEISTVTGSTGAKVLTWPHDPLGDFELAKAWAAGVAEGLGETRVRDFTRGEPLRRLCTAAKSFLGVEASLPPMNRARALEAAIRAAGAEWAGDRRGERLNEFGFAEWLESNRPKPRGTGAMPRQEAPATGRAYRSASEDERKGTGT